MIEFVGLSKCFGTKVAVDSLTLTVPQGAMYGFLGPNGAGKTTTLRMLMGLLHPTRGQAFIDGLDVSVATTEVRRRVGYLPDEVFLYDYLTGQQYLEFVADIHGLPKDTQREKIDFYLNFFDLEDSAGDYTVNYSFGMKKKLALAGIVIHDPTTLLLDEPFNGLDPQATRNCRKLLLSMAQKGVTVLFSSHVLEVVEKLVSHLCIIDAGRSCFHGTLEEALRDHHGSLEEAFFGFTGKTAADAR